MRSPARRHRIMSATSKSVITRAQVFLWKIARAFIQRLWGSVILLLARNKIWLLVEFERNRKQDVSVEVLLVPYDTPACVTQHQALAMMLRALTQRSRVRVLLPKVAKRQVESSKDGTSPPADDLTFETFSGLVTYLIEFVNFDPELARGVIDSFTRECQVSSFFGPHLLPREFLVQVSAQILFASLTPPRPGIVVLADSAYTFNRALISNGLKNRSDIWVANPDGRLSKVSLFENESFYLRTPEDAEVILTSDSELATAAREYFQDRFFGSKDVDFDSRNSKSGLGKIPESLEQKKVLFLHAFRDASQLPISTGGSPWDIAFRTYFEWADFCLSEIAQDRESWAIRSHPSAWAYPGDTEIFRGLVTKHGLQGITSANGVSVRAILEEGLPVFTHSGTVALEAAAFGYKPFVASNRFPEALTVRANSPEEYGRNLKLQFEEARTPISDESSRELAMVLLFERLQNLGLSFVPEPRQPSRSSNLAFQKDLVGQVVSLQRMLLSRDGLEKLRKDAEFILAR